MKRYKVVLILTMIANTSYVPTCWGQLSSVQAAGGLREDTAQLDFVRTDTIQPLKGEQIPVENYIVKEGDYIWKILRERGYAVRVPMAGETLSVT